MLYHVKGEGKGEEEGEERGEEGRGGLLVYVCDSVRVTDLVFVEQLLGLHDGVVA